MLFIPVKATASPYHLKSPEKLGDGLRGIYHTVLTNQKQMIRDKVFNDAAEVEDFTTALLPLIGILETMTENNCTTVSWIAKLY